MAGWRNQDSNQAETKAVKDALAKVGIRARVSHGRGTTCGWLLIKLFEGNWYQLQPRIIEIALAVTGRTGKYDGRIVVAM